MTHGLNLIRQLPFFAKCNNKQTVIRIFLILFLTVAVFFISISYYSSFYKGDSSYALRGAVTEFSNGNQRTYRQNHDLKTHRINEDLLEKDRIQSFEQYSVKNKITESDRESNVYKDILVTAGVDLEKDSTVEDGDIGDASVEHVVEIVDDDDVEGNIDEEEEEDINGEEYEQDHEAERSKGEVESTTVENPDNGDDDKTIENVTSDSSIYQNDDAPQLHWNDSRLDILHMPKLPFDSSFQNPCWYEHLDSPTPYEDNIYATFSKAADRILTKLTDQWMEVYEEEEEPKRLRCLPYFLIIGQPKCGSTDLFWKIAKHPDVDTPPIKELHWWSRSRQGRRLSYSKIIPFSNYVDMFDQAAVRISDRVSNISNNHGSGNHDNRSSQIITGEASVSLFWDNSDWSRFPENWGLREPRFIVPNYLHHLLPNVKLIIVLRDPVERLYSDYLYFSIMNKSADHFHSMVQDAITVYKNCMNEHSLRECVYNISVAYKVKVRLRIGMYSVYLDDWLKVFPRGQFFIFRLEDYSKNQLETLRQIYRFLRLRDLSSVEERAVMASTISNIRSPEHKSLGDMHEKTRLLLKDFYTPFNRKLAARLEDKRFLWEDTE